MAECRISSFVVPDAPPGFVGVAAHAVKAITRCETHDWTFDGPASLHCPIGRIEQAADKAIAKIRREVGDDRSA
jgi:hypothetical protein